MKGLAGLAFLARPASLAPTARLTERPSLAMIQASDVVIRMDCLERMIVIHRHSAKGEWV